MNILIVMIPLSLLIVIGAAACFFWAVNHSQFDDMDSPCLLPIEDGLDDKPAQEIVAGTQQKNLGPNKNA